MKPFFVLFVFGCSATSGEGREAKTAFSKKITYLVAAVAGNFLIGSLAFAGELPVATPSAHEQARAILEKASKEQPWQNSLGMKFVPVVGTQALFSIWDTRLQDFQVFADSAGYEATDGMWSLGTDGWKQRGATWKDPGFEQGSTHPVVGVSWDDAEAFCEWLTKREHASGSLPEGLQYRLPTDLEWSGAWPSDWTTRPGTRRRKKAPR